MADEEETTNKIHVTLNITLHTAFKLPSCAFKLNRRTKGNMEEGKGENKEQSKTAGNCSVTLPVRHSAVHPTA